MNNIAVTGSSGFIGKHLVEALRKKNKNIIQLDVDNGFNLLNEKISNESHFLKLLFI